MVELRQVPSANSNQVLLAGNAGSAFLKYDFTSFTTDADVYDFNGYSLKKTYHYLRIDPQTISDSAGFADSSGNEKWYISIYDPKGTSIFTYTLSVFLSLDQPCPDSCGTFGEAYCVEGFCNCPNGWIDEDCSWTGVLLSSSQQQGQLLEPSQMQYFYYNIPDKFNDTLALRVQKNSNTDLRIYLSFSNFTIITLPTTDYYLGKPLDLTKNENVFYLMIEKWVYRNDFYYGSRQIYFGNFLSLNSGIKLLKGVVNLDSAASTVYLSITSSYISSTTSSSQDETSGNNNLYLIVIASVISIILFLLLVCLCRYCFSRRPRSVNLHDHAVNLGGPLHQPIHMHNRIKKKKEKIFTPDLINNFLPEIIFARYQKLSIKKDIENSCAVCLEEFTSNDICRESICKHIFHKECLDTWMIKHENCPYCRTVMDEPALEEHRKKEVQRLSEKPSNLDDQMQLIDLEDSEGKNRASGEGTVGRIDSISPLRVEIQNHMHQKKNSQVANSP